jgi:hypothetical protein
MAEKKDETDPRFLVEIGSERFDPKAEGAKARRRVSAAKKKLASALGVEPAELPGAEREGWLVQLEADPEAETVRRFRDDYGLQLTQGVSSLTFIERMDGENAARVRRDPEVRAVVPFSPELKREPLGPGMEPASTRLEIGLIEGDDLDAVTSMLEALGVTVLLVNDDTGSGGGLSLLAEAATDTDLTAVAAIDDVAWITRVGDVTVKNVDTAGVAQSGDAASHPVWAKGLHGEGMIIGVIDAGEIDLLSKFLRDSGQASAAAGHRKVVDNRKAAGANVSPDPSHPMFTTGCGAADEEGNAGAHANRGGAWGAKLAYGDIFRVFGSSPSGSLTAEFEAAATAGARIHSNSWGINFGAAAPAYDGSARDIDGFLWQNEDHLCPIAAPNPGGSFEGGLVIAKNPILVGGVRESPNQNDRRADPAPLTADGRRKPDLLAVAENVTTSDLTGGGAAVLAVTTVSGNSYATPHVAAAAALVRQYFTEGWYPSGKKEAKNRVDPTGTLLKAMLLNATIPLTGAASHPSARDGWGRLQLNRTLHFDGDKLILRVWDIRRQVGVDRDGQTETYALPVPANAKSLRVTLVFNDPSGAVGAADPVVNKLDVELGEPFPSRFGYFGNDFDNKVSRRRDITAAGLSVPPSPAELKNNVRQILVNAPAEGGWGIVVRAHKVDQANTPVTVPFLRRLQGYAMVACVELN